MTRHRERVAVIGAGLTGCCVAILLARGGYSVTVFEEAEEPMSGASRWNEGRLHLGYVYGADTSLNTARRMIPATLSFRPIINQIIGEDISTHCTATDDYYLVHRRSVIAPDPLNVNLIAINALVREHPHADSYVTPLSHAGIRRLSTSEIEDVSNPEEVVGGFRVPERSVETLWLSDRLTEVLRDTPGIELVLGTAVSSAKPVDLPMGQWQVSLADGRREVFDRVVNASWNGLLEIDQTAGILLDFEWSHRYRLSIFAKTVVPVRFDSVFVAVGPFGVVKNHNERLFCLSWYETGLQTYTEEVRAVRGAPLSEAGRTAYISATRASLEKVMPAVRQVFDNAAELRVEGGFVLAQATGDIGQPNASLHRRDRFGIKQRGNYLSIDPGKFATSPFMAAQAVREHFGVEFEHKELASP